MIKIKLGNWPFFIPQHWGEVTPKQAAQLYLTAPEAIHERVSILGGIPGPNHMKLSAEVLLAVYELCSFIEEVPELVPDLHKVTPLKYITRWSFAEFEAGRQAVMKHLSQPSIAMYRLAEIKGKEAHFLEMGAKALDGMNQFIQSYSVFGIFDSNEEEAEGVLGVELLQAFGVYPILESIAEKYGKLPTEIEQQPVGWVIKEYAHNHVKAEVLERNTKKGNNHE